MNSLNYSQFPNTNISGNAYRLQSTNSYENNTIHIYSAALIALGFAVGTVLCLSLFVPTIGAGIIISAGLTSAILPGVVTGLCVKAYYRSKNVVAYKDLNNARQNSAFGKKTEQTSKVTAPRQAEQAARQTETAAWKYSFEESTTKWLKNCGISSSIDPKKVLIFKQNLFEFGNQNKLEESTSKQKAAFERVMGIKNLRDSDFNTFIAWMDLEKPPVELANDPVLKHCVCPLSKEYPHDEVIDPTDMTTIYDRLSIKRWLKHSNQSPKTEKVLDAGQLISTPEVRSIIQFRLYELAILNKQSYFW